MIDKTRVCTVGGSCGVGLLGLFCPLCIPAFAAFLSSVGLGFVATETVIWPLLAILSLLLLYGLMRGYRCHKNIWPLVIGVFGMLAIPLGRYVIIIIAVTYIGVVAVVGAALWNLVLRKTCKTFS